MDQVKADHASRYGYQHWDTSSVDEVTALRESVDHSRQVPWTDKQLVRVLRFRLLTDPGFPVWDVSYCYGEMADGTRVRVVLPFDQLRKRGWQGHLLEYARRDGVHARGLGFFDADVYSTLR